MLFEFPYDAAVVNCDKIWSY